MNFPERLKQIRQEKGMTQQEFADLLGTSKQVISRYEHGENTPKITTVVHYAKVLNVPITYFTDESSETPIKIKLKKVTSVNGYGFKKA